MTRIKIIVKVGNVLDKILTQNNSFDVASYPDLRVNHRRSATQNAKDFKFYITADYDFEKQIWKSWWFEIERNRWRDSETYDYKYPVLLDRFYFYKDPVRSAWIVHYWYHGVLFRLVNFNPVYRIGVFSSNNQEHIDSLSGFYFCEMENELKLTPSKVAVP